MVRKATQRYDQTQLRKKSHGRTVHRDYASHFFRWGFVGSRVHGHRVLDVGCGQDTPFIYQCSRFESLKPEMYLGVDMNKFDEPQVKWTHWKQKFDFVTRWKEILDEFGVFDTAVCLEVIEHMEKDDGSLLLEGIYECLDFGGTLYLSTPVFNGKAARNHVHEYTIKELKESIEAAGFFVEARYGTFASWGDIKKVASQQEMALMKQLKEWYSTEVLSCFLAPIYPDSSRNNAWVLRKLEAGKAKKKKIARKTPKKSEPTLFDDQ